MRIFIIIAVVLICLAIAAAAWGPIATVEWPVWACASFLSFLVADLYPRAVPVGTTRTTTQV